MITCKDCKHWNTKEYTTPEDGVEIGHCIHPKWDYGYGKKGPMERDKICVENDEGWGMYCGPDFGCVHGERK